MQNETFLKDVQTLIRYRAEQHIGDEAPTSGSRDQQTVIKLLNDWLVTANVCVLRDRRHHFMAKEIQSKSVAEAFLERSNEERRHADQIAERIVQLGGEPKFVPDRLESRSHAEYAEGESPAEMINDDLLAERIAIDSYREIIQYLGDKDRTTKRMLEGILAVEEGHAHEIAELLEGLAAELKQKKCTLP